MQLRTELDDAGLCPERVELLWELYEKARSKEEQQREAPAGALADAGALDEPAAAPASQVFLLGRHPGQQSLGQHSNTLPRPIHNLLRVLDVTHLQCYRETLCS